MGYDSHITRAEKWLYSMSSPILLDEWRELVEKDLEMNMDGIATATTPLGESITYRNEGLATWYPDLNDKSNKVWFDYKKGRIVVKNPDTKTMKKMQDLIFMGVKYTWTVLLKKSAGN